MRKDKETAIELRKLGKSYSQIRAELKIPKSTLSDWFRDIDWSGMVRSRLAEAAKNTSTLRIRELDRVRGEHLAQVYQEAAEEARKEFKVLKYNPLFIAGMMLYWGEGDKTTKNQMRLSNSDPELIRLYVGFLEKACRVPSARIKAQLIIYPDIEEQSNRRFWSFASGIPLDRFTKSTLIQGRHKTKRLRYGVCNVVVSSTYFKVKIIEWLKLLPKELMEKQYYESI
jgi:hypothetical protein